MSLKSRLFLSIAFFFAVVTFLFSDAPFIWDKDLLDSRQAFWFTENSFNLVLPDSLDPGHPPFVGMILAILWTAFGKTLAVGHWFMYLITLGVVWQIIRFAGYFVNKQYLILFSLILFLDPTLLAQTIIVSSDLIVIFFFLYSINSLFYKQEWHLYFALAGLSVVNMRGTLTVGIIFLFHLYFIGKSKKISDRFLRVIKYYLPSILLPLLFHVFHFLEKGWVGYHELSPWADCYEKVNFGGMIRNVAVTGWRFIDYGRVVIWIVGALVLFKNMDKIRVDTKIKYLLFLFVFSASILIPPMIVYKNLLSPRYLLLLFIIFAATVSYVLFRLTNYSLKKKVLIGVIFILSLISGNFWVYPEKIAQAWDSTLGHIPYYKLKKEMIKFVEEQNIIFEDVGTVTPDKYPLKHYYLNDIENQLVARTRLKDHKYIYYSNFHNEYTDKEIDELKSNWQLVTEQKSFPLFVQLYKNPKYE